MTKHQRTVYRSSHPEVDLMITDKGQVTIPGCTYTWEQLAEMRAVLEEHLRDIDQFPDPAVAGTISHTRTVLHDRTGSRELGLIDRGVLSITAYSLTINQAQDFYHLLSDLLDGKSPSAAPAMPTIVPTPILFHNLCKN